jgi:hypothetical protein
MAQPAVKEMPPKTRTITHVNLTPQECREIAREEKIFIYFLPRNSSGNKYGDWKITPALKAVSVGHEVTWQALGRCDELRLELPADTFTNQVSNGNTVTATVKADAQPGLHFYEAFVDKQLAIGGSSPGVIIDPHR